MKNSIAKNNASKPGLVPPAVAALFSLLLPGAGQMLTRDLGRGLFYLGSTAASITLLWWRMRDTAKYDDAFWDIVRKAFRLDPILIVLAALLFLSYLWIVFDAYQRASHKRSASGGLLFVVIVVYFLLGWQIGDIRPLDFITKIGDARSAMGRIIWPWEAAIDREPILQIGGARIQVPCTDDPIPPTEPLENEPYIIATPTCGKLSEQDGERGSAISLEGHQFQPNIDVELWWIDPIGNDFRQRQKGDYVIIEADDEGSFSVDIVMPYRLLPTEAEEGEVNIWKIQGRQLKGYLPAKASESLQLAISKMIETIFLGMMATFFGIILSVPVSFLAARNLMSASPIMLGIYFLTRTILNIIRSIEPLIWAVIAVVVVGLGPFAGILALTLHTIAALGKLYSEAIESIDPGPIEAIEATGANWVQVIVFGVVPQIIPPFVSFTIYRWDINVRMSTVIGLVGGGGIGFVLIQWIRLLDYRSAGIAVWFIAITVAILDFVSSEIRQRFV